MISPCPGSGQDSGELSCALYRDCLVKMVPLGQKFKYSSGGGFASDVTSEEDTVPSLSVLQSDQRRLFP